MKINNLSYIFGICLNLIASSVFAQNPNITVTDDSGVPGASVSVNLVWNPGGATYNGVELKVDYDETILVFNSCTLNEPYASYNLAICRQVVADPNSLEVGLIDNFGSPGPVPAGTIGSLSFTILGGASVGDTALIINGVVLPGDPVSDLVDGTITVLAPDYSSSPGPGPLAVGSGQTGGANPSTVVSITNVGGAGTGLDVSCVESPNTTAFIVANGVVTGLAKNASHDVTVACNAALAPNTYTGTMVCTHNGDGTTTASPAEYALSCTITPGPMPAYSSSPAAGTPIGMGATYEGDAITPVNVSISNSGDTGTTLTGTCGLTGDSEISVADGAFSVVQGGAADIQAVSCDSSVEGNYSATLSCSHNGSNASPATYAVTCDVGGKRPAVFDSTPSSGSTTDMTSSLDVVVGDAAPESTLTFFNTAQALSSNLSLACSKSGGDAAITVTPDISGGIMITPQGNSSVTFSCDTSSANNYSATYFCDYRTDGVDVTGVGGTGTASYTFTCDVREPEASVSENPVSGTTLTTLVSTGQTGNFQVTFSENADENIDGELVECALDDGSAFSITSPASFPVAIPAGGSLAVTVEGTDPGGVQTVQDVLRCTYSDSNSDNTEVFYNLVLQIGSVATFTVTKDFKDNNPGEVGVSISCDNGLPIKSDSTVSEGSPVTFIVGTFESGKLNCEIFESPVPAGYTPRFSPSGDSNSDRTKSSCVFTEVDRGDENNCLITNTPDPVDVVIEKEWLFKGSSSDLINPSYVLTLFCDAEIIGGDIFSTGTSYQTDLVAGNSTWYKAFNLVGPATVTAEVIPEYPSSNCRVKERVFDDSVETENNCGNLVVSAGKGDSCVITNTVFFEGIPSLNRYGLAILALLMLGVGMVGFRRFS